MARALRKIFDVNQKQAERLMRTESARVHAECAVNSMTEHGVTQYEWVAEPSACDLCGPLDGKVFEVKGAEFGNVKHPLFPLHPNCRCAVIPAVGVNNNKESGAIVESGALSDENDLYLVRRTEHAKNYYEAVRNRDRKIEISKIAENTGFPIKGIEQVYNHVFIEKHQLSTGYQRFYPDYDMAQSWQRLREGKNIQKNDLIMLEHELFESILMKNGISDYKKAHKMTEKVYNYSKEIK